MIKIDHYHLEDQINNLFNSELSDLQKIGYIKRLRIYIKKQKNLHRRYAELTKEEKENDPQEEMFLDDEGYFHLPIILDANLSMHNLPNDIKKQITQQLEQQQELQNMEIIKPPRFSLEQIAFFEDHITSLESWVHANKKNKKIDDFLKK